MWTQVRKRNKVEQRAWAMMSKSIGPRVWAGSDLLKAFVLGLLLALMIAPAVAGPLEHDFKSPSFSGVNQSSHYLTIENQETSRKDKLAQELEDAAKQAQRDADNTTQAKFIRNVESRIYSTLSRQIVEEMFGENPSSEGSFEVDGTGITYVTDEDQVELTITDEYGKVTVITVPIGDFGI